MKKASVSRLVLVGSILANVVLLSILVFGNNGSEASNTRFPYLAKRIFVEEQNDVLINFTILRNRMRNYIAQQEYPVGVYFEYLPSGVSIGVNDDMEARLVSLVKVPLVMAVYKEIEEGRVKESDKLVIEKKHLDTTFGEVWLRGAGATMTVKEAVEHTLIESDNTTTNMLVELVGSDAIQLVFDSLDVSIDKTDGPFHIITPKSYSSMLRSLYLSSYLEREHSDEILSIMTKTRFKDKIPAGVPSDVLVAHKVGFFDMVEIPGKTFSDCGIVYVPGRPYLLCIVTETSDTYAREHMSTISRMVYEYVSRASW